jgi:GTP-binding protein YchF
MEKLGLVGLPNAGKSSLFNALTGANAVVAPHPFSTTETTVGIAQVYDERLEKLAEMAESRKVVPAGVEFADIAALAKGASTGEGLGNRFLGSLREVDALVYVLRAFEDPSVMTATGGDPDPADDLATLEFELVLADLGAVEGRIHRQGKAARGDKSILPEIAALERAKTFLDEGTPLYRATLSADERDLLKPSFLLTTKPFLTVVNIGEDQLDDAAKLAEPFGPGGPGVSPGSAISMGPALAVSVQLEAEASRLEPGERSELLEGLGLGEGVVPRVAAAAYQLLGRRTFLTTGPDESRAWTFRAGARAPECAGVIHSDLQRGFIRAEVIRWDELLSIGSWPRAKELGKLRVEGKDYEVADGDVLEIRFNV